MVAEHGREQVLGPYDQRAEGCQSSFALEQQVGMMVAHQQMKSTHASVM